MNPVYLDYNATTPIAPEVLQAMLPYLRQYFGNPSSGHDYGVEPARAMRRARAQVAACLGAQPNEILFTSGGTEANNHAIIGAARAMRQRGHHIITQTTEHPAVVNVCRFLERDGWQVTWLPVSSEGMVNPDDLRRALTQRTVLVSIMTANNETGTLLPVAELAALTHEAGALFHTDAAQAVGKIPVDVGESGVDLLTVAGHKLFAPKGVGALYVRSGTPLENILHGAGQEDGRRPGTENVPYAVALGAACELVNADLPRHAERLAALRDRLWNALVAAGLNMRRNGHPVHRLPNTLSVAFRGLNAHDLLAEIADDVAASAGAACHSDSVDISPVLAAMGVKTEDALGTVRLSVGRYTTEGEADRAAAAIIAAADALHR